LYNKLKLFNYLYIKRIFYNLEDNKYSNMNDIYIYDNNIYDKNLIKLLFKNLIYLSQNKNSNLWLNKLENKYFKIFNMNNFKIDYDIIKNPSTLLINDKILVYEINNKKYCSLNVIVSKYDYSPYYEKKIFEINKTNSKFILDEINEIDNNIFPNLLENIAINITNLIIN